MSWLPRISMGLTLDQLASRLRCAGGTAALGEALVADGCERQDVGKAIIRRWLRTLQTRASQLVSALFTPALIRHTKDYRRIDRRGIAMNSSRSCSVIMLNKKVALSSRSAGPGISDCPFSHRATC